MPDDLTWRGDTYYGLPSVKASPWDWKVSAYIFIAGLAGMWLPAFCGWLGIFSLRGLGAEVTDVKPGSATNRTNAAVRPVTFKPYLRAYPRYRCVSRSV